MPVIDSMLRESGGERSGTAIKLIRVAESLTDAVAHADYVQESVPEDLQVKRQTFEEMSRAVTRHCVLASSASGLLPSLFLDSLLHRERALVAHPFNPPHLVPLVEVVPSPWTDVAVTQAAMTLLREIGQEPVLIRKEVTGYVGNRLQAAVVCEAVSLVARGVVSPEELDKCMVYGLGRRWAFMGPFQTMALNSLAGFGDYVRKYRSVYLDLARSLELSSEWPDEAINAIDRYLTDAEQDQPGYLDRKVRDKKLARFAEFYATSLRTATKKIESE
jgi:3-hydroxyacyl-CoA dehydrogenase